MTHITDYLARNAQLNPTKTALVTDDKTMSWHELWQAVEPASQAIRQRFTGDRQALIAILISNTWEYVVSYLAILHAGHIAVPIDVIYKPLEIDAIIKQMKPGLIISDQANKKRIDDKTKVISLDQLTASPENLAPLRLDATEQIATIFFTSGTTGKPKAAPYSHANHLWNIKVCTQAWDWNDQDSLLLSLRLSHWYGSVMGLSGIIYHANTLYLQDRFTPESTLNLLASGKVTMFTHAPLVYAKLIEAGRQKSYDLSGARLFISGSGPLSPQMWQDFKDTFGHEILEVYGSSETGRIASNRLNERIPGSPGRLLDGVDVKLINGEVTVKSPGVFPGYYHNDELTRAGQTTDGYWRTGDLGEFSPDGRLILKGRLKEIIRRQGYSISPRDVEWALHVNPAIDEVAVVGQTDEDKPDDKIVYFLVSKASKEEVMEFCRQNLPSVWRPDQIIYLDELPRTSRGKINMGALRAMIN